MTSPIEGTQGDNGRIEPDYEPMRPDDPHQGEEREPIALGGHQQPDPETAALLEEASDLVVEALARPEHERLGYTPVPEGGEITEQFYVHDEPPAPKGEAARRQLDDAVPVVPATIYLACQGIDSEGYTQVIGARTTLDSAMALVTEHAGALRAQLRGWKKYGSGSWVVRLGEKPEYYEILTLPVLP